MLLAWIKNIVLFILFSSLVFFLLPDEKYRKYMQTAVGFVLAIIVLTPVLSAGGLNDILSIIMNPLQGHREMEMSHIIQTSWRR